MKSDFLSRDEDVMDWISRKEIFQMPRNHGASVRDPNSHTVGVTLHEDGTVSPTDPAALRRELKRLQDLKQERKGTWHQSF